MAYVKPPMVPPVSPDYQPRQIYLNAAPSGVDAYHAWTFPGGAGAGVRIIDIEYNWNLNHEDLISPASRLLAGTVLDNADWKNHGTAVLGILKGQPNGFGVSGLCPDATVDVIASTGYGTAQAIRQAVDFLSAGDVLLLEMQRPGPRFNFSIRSDQAGYISVEWWPDDYEAIRYATDKGIIVVEASGNGSENLSDALYDTNPSSPNGPFPSWWVNPFRRTTLDSRALIIGAGAPPPGTHGQQTEPDRSRRPFSNYGAMVDAQGWGAEVTTTGYGTLHAGSGENEWYRDNFSGTSAATAIVAGVLGSLQGALKGAGKSVLTPLQARAALRATGSPQQAGTNTPTSQRIGNRADLKALFSYVGLVSVYTPSPSPTPTPPPPYTPPYSTSPPSLGTPESQLTEQDFRLIIYTPSGDGVERTLTDSDEDGLGIDDGIESTVTGGAAKTMTFSGRADLIGCTGAEIVRFEANDGSGWYPCGFGTVLKGWSDRTDESNQVIRTYTVSADELLRASLVIGNEVYPPQDPAAIARQLAEKYRHPALAFKAENFPATGTRMDNAESFMAYDLLTAFEQLAARAQTAGSAPIVYGVNPSGEVFFAAHSGKTTLDYNPAEFADLEINAEGLCTAVLWYFGNTPSVPGYGGEYQPGDLAYLSVPDPELHRRYRRPIARQVENTAAMFVYRAAETASSNGFKNPENAWNTDTNGNPIAGAVSSNGVENSNPPFFQIGSTTGKPRYGVSIRYRCTLAVPPVTLRIGFYVRDPQGASFVGEAQYKLPYSDLAYTRQNYYLTPAKDYTDENGVLYTVDQSVGFHYAIVQDMGYQDADNYFAISDFRFFSLNYAALDNAARRELKTPAVNPATLEPRRDAPEGRRGFYIPPVGNLELFGTPWNILSAPMPEVRYTYTKLRGFQTYIDIGNPAREGENASLLESVALGLERRLARSEIKGGGRL